MWERGYADTSPRDVRERSGVGQGSIYHHFPTKRDLALAALERNVSDLLPAAADRGRRQPGQGARLVRQRVGILQPPRRVLRADRRGHLTPG